jgi:hypothetical protein
MLTSCVRSLGESELLDCIEPLDPESANAVPPAINATHMGSIADTRIKERDMVAS